MEEQPSIIFLTRWIISSIVVLVIVSIMFVWLVFFSPVFINSKTFIPAQNWININIKEKLYPYFPEFLPYSVSVRETYEMGGKRYYGYTVIGKFVSMDYQNDIIVLKDQWGRVWNFKYNLFSNLTEPGYWRLQYIESTLKPGKPQETVVKQMIIYKDQPEEILDKFKIGDVIIVYWNETRTLSQILNVNKKNGEPIPLFGSGREPIVKVIID